MGGSIVMLTGVSVVMELYSVAQPLVGEDIPSGAQSYVVQSGILSSWSSHISRWSFKYMNVEIIGLLQDGPHVN